MIVDKAGNLSQRPLDNATKALFTGGKAILNASYVSTKLFVPSLSSLLLKRKGSNSLSLQVHSSVPTPGGEKVDTFV